MNRVKAALQLAMVALASAVPSFPQSSVSVINYAGFTGAFPVAPGSIASAYGDFGAVATTSAETLSPMPRELAGLRVRVNNADAPLYFVSRNQINFVMPVATPVGRQTVQVVSGGNVVASGFVNIYSIGPALAALTADPSRPGIVQNQNFAVNGSSAPARAGEIVQIYATGCGATSPAVQEDRPPAELSNATADIRVYFLENEVRPQFAGAHPQFPGICQINAIVPGARGVSGQVPVHVTVNGVPSNPVSIWVQ